MPELTSFFCGWVRILNVLEFLAVQLTFCGKHIWKHCSDFISCPRPGITSDVLALWKLPSFPFVSQKGGYEHRPSREHKD